MAVDAITCTGLIKRKGSRSIVNGVDLSVPQGSVFGLLGPNGAGKTSIMKMILGLARPSSGEVVVFGERVPVSPSTLARIGAMVEEPAFYPWMDARRFLHVTLGSRGPASVDAVERALQRFKLQDTGSKKIKAFSQGMRQRLGLAAATLGSPDLLVLDEPANGLDPAGIVELRETLLSLRDEGVTILVSSHQLLEAERTCDRLAIIRDGRVALEGTPEEIRSNRDLEERFLDTVAGDGRASVQG